jgi:hypothetical protein
MLVEQTGLSKEMVEKVVDARLRFYLEHPGYRGQKISWKRGKRKAPSRKKPPT